MIWCEGCFGRQQVGDKGAIGATALQSWDLRGSIVVIILVITVGDGFEVEVGDYLSLCV